MPSVQGDGPGPAARQLARSRPIASFVRLTMGRVDVVVAQDLGWLALVAGLYRSWFRTMSFFVLLTEPPAALRRIDRMILRLADGVLVDGDATARAVAKPEFPARSVRRITPGYPLGAAPDPVRRAPADGARRIVVASPLSPQSGTPDLLASIATWAEAHPECKVKLTWAGEGDLAGVLAAQPLPRNMTQSFPGAIGAEEADEAFAQAEFLIVPGLGDDERPQVVAGFAAGLPVLGSRRRRDVRRLVTEGVNGWLFDPARPGDLLAALDRALEVPDDALQTMRVRAQAALQGPVTIRMPSGPRRQAPATVSSPSHAALPSLAQRVP